MEDAIVLYPCPAIGHLVSMVELGKLILAHYPSLSVTVLLAHPPCNTGYTAPYISRVSATTPAITFHHLPTVPLSLLPCSPTHEILAFQLLRLNNPHVRQSLLSISQTHTIRALVVDFFCTPAVSVATDLNLPSYNFFTSGAAVLSSFFYLPTFYRNNPKVFGDLHALLHIPGLPPLAATDMPRPMVDPTDKAYQDVLDSCMQLLKQTGIIVNTFESLEPRGVEAMRNGLCVPGGPTPPIYCIGPLIAGHDGGGADGDEKHESLVWLDSQPSQSVVFLCFGSRGLFSAQQLKETAVGLERSGQRFLWVVRSPPPEDHCSGFSALLPEGFLERTRERGLVVKQWAPQVAVLSHDAVGGFVTHCGWNSILEAICAGKPMVAWPLYAEQRLNRVLLVEEMKLALPMNESEGGFVSAAEVERRVSELMDSVEGKRMRDRIKTRRGEAVAAASVGGSSKVALAELVGSWKVGSN